MSEVTTTVVSAWSDNILMKTIICLKVATTFPQHLQKFMMPHRQQVTVQLFPDSGQGGLTGGDGRGEAQRRRLLAALRAAHARGRRQGGPLARAAIAHVVRDDLCQGQTAHAAKSEEQPQVVTGTIREWLVGPALAGERSKEPVELGKELAGHEEQKGVK